MSDSFFTHKSLADLLGVSETTIKSYRRKFPGCLPVANQGKPIRFTAQAVAVGTRIRDYFSSGMSVQDLRLRLSTEFPWVQAEAEEPGVTTGSISPAPELAQGVSNMAKSMVSMAQQQQALVKRMQGLEYMLTELGLDAKQVGALSQVKAQQGRAKEEQLEQRLQHLDTVTQDLAEAFAAMAEQLSRFLGHRVLPDKGAETKNQDEHAKVIPLRPLRQPQNKPDLPVEPKPQEPSRLFFTLPLVVRTAQGSYTSVGGRGRFCLNDLKAKLVYGYTPPDHFTFSFESHGQGWWLLLEQPQKETPRSIRMLLMEIATQRGEQVIEILQLKDGDNAVHPTNIRTLIDDFGAEGN